MGLNSFLEDSPEHIAVVDSSVESENLGLRVGRAFAGVKTVFAVDDLPELLRDPNFDVIIFRYPATETQVNARLIHSGLTTWQADTLVYVNKPIAEASDCDIRGIEMSLELVQVEDVDQELEEIIELAFANYSNHYASNPRFTQLGASPYIDWLKRDLKEDRQICWKFRNEHNEIVGFISAQVEGDRLELPLSGFRPEFQGRGYYEQMLVLMSRYALEIECPEIAIATQAGNIAVMRTWAKQGFKPILSVNTVYVEPNESAD